MILLGKNPDFHAQAGEPDFFLAFIGNFLYSYYNYAYLSKQDNRVFTGKRGRAMSTMVVFQQMLVILLLIGTGYFLFRKHMMSNCASRICPA